MTQPALGLLSSAIVMAIALGFISLFDFGTFAGWIAFTMLGLIPMQVVAVVLWAAIPHSRAGCVSQRRASSWCWSPWSRHW